MSSEQPTVPEAPRPEEEYRIVKEPVSVALTLEGGEVLAGDLFLLPRSGMRDGRERVLDLLLGPEAFLPLRTDAGVQLVSKERVVLAKVSDAHDAGLRLDAVPVRELEITVRLALLPAGQQTVTGRVQIAAPSPHARLADLLNEPTPVLPLLDDGGALLVSKRHILTVRSQSY